ncbi:MAG: hypothetical protein E7480_00875 [Ruminococcaceae bacterium]|nr:hypothetical protein [Oscillospiraceae bacterium]
MKNNKKIKILAQLLNVVIIFGVFIFMFIFGLFFTRTQRSDYDKDLKKFPTFTISTFLSGDYTADIASWYTDTIHNRDRFKDMAAKIKYYYGVKKDEEVFGTVDIPDEETESSDIVSSDIISSDIVSSESSSSEVSSEPPVNQDEEIAKGILILGTRAMELDYGSIKYGTRYAQALNEYAKQLEGKSKVYSMVIPKSCAYYMQESKNEEYRRVASLTPKNLNNIRDNLDGVIEVDVYNTLLKHTKEEIYCRTDHHWTGLGAYYAAQELAKVAGVDFADISTYEKNVRPGYVGTMYKFTGNSAKLLNNPEDFVTYIPSTPYTASYYTTSFEYKGDNSIFYPMSDAQRSSWYSTYIGGDNNVVKITSGTCKNGRKLLILKDSYGNALSPYFLNSFEEVYMADIRHFQKNVISFVEEQGITDTVFAMCTFSAMSKDRINDIEKLRTR